MKKHLKKGLEVLGVTYSVKRIGFEDCLYKDLGNGIDFEISHVRSGYSVFVCQYKPYLRILESFPKERPAKLSELKSLMDELEKKYADWRKEINECL